MRAYLKELAEKLRVFLAEENLHKIVLGCREDLWGEAKPAFAGFGEDVLIGLFHHTNYDMPTSEVRSTAYPIFQEPRRNSGAALWKRINDEPARGAVGIKAIMPRPIEGRVHKLILAKPVNSTLRECDVCGNVQPSSEGLCTFCDSTSFHDLSAEEGMIRQAVLTDAEILTFEKDEIPGVSGAAAYLRF